MIERISRGVTWHVFAATVAVLLSASLVWYQAPRISIDGRSLFATSGGRVWLIVVIFTTGIVIYILRWLVRRARRVRIVWNSSELESKMDNQVDSSEREYSGAKEARLRLRRSVVAALKIVRRGGPLWRLGRHSAYRLPWYLVIGAENSGKTALLEASGLKFWHDEMTVVAQDTGEGYQWWFADDAVMLEARSFDAVNRHSLDGILRALGRARRRCAINGLIITVNVCMLLDEDDANRRAWAMAMRESIDAMYRKFGIRFPIYVVLTHCDLVAGFSTFFDGLSLEECGQVWGVTFANIFDNRQDELLESIFSDEFDALTQQLQARVIDQLPIRSDPDRSAAMYGFPHSFSVIGEPLKHLLADVFGVSPYARQTLLRGVYFTAAQSGILRGASHPAGSRLGHFITQLLRAVVFRDAGLVGTRSVLTNHRGLRFVIGGGIVMLTIAIGAAMCVSYTRNLTLLDRTVSATTEFAKLAKQGVVMSSPLSMLSVLNVARDLPGGYAQREVSVPLLSRMGLYQGERVGGVAQAQYYLLLKTIMQPFVAERWASSLRSGALLDRSKRYDLLRAYLMLGDRAHYDMATVLDQAKDDLRGLVLTNAQRSELIDHAVVLFRPMFATDSSLDAALIAQTRNALTMRPLGERLFESIRPNLEATMSQPLSVAQMAGVDGPLVMRRKSGQPLSEGVPGAYTLAGYRRYIVMRDSALDNAGKERWVLGEKAGYVDAVTRVAISADMDRYYFERYIAAWDSLINDVTLLPLPKSEDSAALVKLLSGRDSPLRLFLQSVAKETTLGGGSGNPAAGTDAGSNTFDKLVRSVHSMFSANKGNPRRILTGQLGSMPSAPAELTLVDNHFVALHHLIESESGATAAPIDEVLVRLRDVAVFLDAVNAAHARGLPAPPGDAIDRLRQATLGLPGALSSMLMGLSDNSTAILLGDERVRLNGIWQANVAAFCHAALDRRYPFNSNSKIDVTLDDFARVFRPGGLIDTFFQTNLLPYVDTTTNPWTWRATASNLQMSADVLQQFALAAQVRDAFFPDGNKTMTVHFSITPQSMDSTLTRFVLNLNGQTLSYAHDPRRPSSFEWPTTNGSQAARIDYESFLGDGGGGFQTEGPWAVFRLLERAELQMKQPDHFVMTFNMSGRKVELELNADSVANPFALTSLQQFRCLDHL